MKYNESKAARRCDWRKDKPDLLAVAGLPPPTFSSRFQLRLSAVQSYRRTKLRRARVHLRTSPPWLARLLPPIPPPQNVAATTATTTAIPARLAATGIEEAVDEIALGTVAATEIAGETRTGCTSGLESVLALRTTTERTARGTAEEGSAQGIETTSATVTVTARLVTTRRGRKAAALMALRDKIVTTGARTTGTTGGGTIDAQTITDERALPAATKALLDPPTAPLVRARRTPVATRRLQSPSGSQHSSQRSPPLPPLLHLLRLPAPRSASPVFRPARRSALIRPKRALPKTKRS
jgi:hypothetical protein